MKFIICVLTFLFIYFDDTDATICKPLSEFRLDCNRCRCSESGREYSCSRFTCAYPWPRFIQDDGVDGYVLTKSPDTKKRILNDNKEPEGDRPIRRIRTVPYDDDQIYLYKNIENNINHSHKKDSDSGDSESSDGGGNDNENNYSGSSDSGSIVSGSNDSEPNDSETNDSETNDSESNDSKSNDSGSSDSVSSESNFDNIINRFYYAIPDLEESKRGHFQDDDYDDNIQVMTLADMNRNRLPNFARRFMNK